MNMISREELIKEISNIIGKTKVLELSRIVKEQNFSLRDLTDLTFHQDKDIAFRSAWILENVFLNDPETYEADLKYIVSRIKDVNHPSCQRHYAKIIMHITAGNASPVIRNKLKLIDLEPVVEQCFEWMIDPKVKIAVKVFASEAMFNLKDRYPWIKDELAGQLQLLMRNGSPGIQSRGKKLLAKI